MKKLFAAAIMALAALLYAGENDNTSAPSAASKTSDTAPGKISQAELASDSKLSYSEYELSVAIELLKAKGTPETLSNSFSALLETQIKAVPELEKYRSILESFYQEAFSFDALKTDLAKLYLKQLTLNEISEILSFYNSPAGARFAKVESGMGTGVAQLLLERQQKLMPELEKKLAAAAASDNGK